MQKKKQIVPNLSASKVPSNIREHCRFIIKDKSYSYTHKSTHPNGESKIFELVIIVHNIVKLCKIRPL